MIPYPIAFREFAEKWNEKLEIASNQVQHRFETVVSGALGLRRLGRWCSRGAGKLALEY